MARVETPVSADISLPLEDLAVLYSRTNSMSQRRSVLPLLGPLRESFERFLVAEEIIDPPSGEELTERFESCLTGDLVGVELLTQLRELAPGGALVGSTEVNVLIDYVRQRVARHVGLSRGDLGLLPHTHAFGSGGDFWKTAHATTNAAIVAAPRAAICKTGTSNVTSLHGSQEAALEIGYRPGEFDANRLNRELELHGFSYLPLAALGFPYSAELRDARRALWNEAVASLRTVERPWHEAMRSPIILDIFKVVSPNAQVLDPAHHTNGVCHVDMIPYVLGVYMHLNTEGFVVHSYDGIDELSNAATTSHRPNNVLIEVSDGMLDVVEFGPEDVGLPRCAMTEIAELTLAEEAQNFWAIVDGSLRGAKRDFIVLNAALLLSTPEHRTTTGVLERIAQNVHVAAELIDSGEAARNVQALLAH